MTAPPMRCQHYIAGGPRCTTDATHYLKDEKGLIIGVYCADHGSLIVDEYREKLGWEWSLELLEEETDD